MSFRISFGLPRGECEIYAVCDVFAVPDQLEAVADEGAKWMLGTNAAGCVDEIFIAVQLNFLSGS